MNGVQKRASWIELFYDLAYVALVAQLTYLVADYHSTLQDWLNIGIVGYAIFIAWWTTSVNRNMQESETASDKLIIQVKMVGAFLMSVTMPAVFVGGYTGFFLALASVRFLQVVMLLRMYRLYPVTAPVTYNVVQGLAVAGVLWAISAVTLDPYHYVLALMALVIDITVPLSVGKGNQIRLLNISHLKERLGLFLMLVMGESMIVVALSNTATSVTLTEPLAMMAGLAFMVALWWLYFDHQDRTVDVRPRNLFMFLHAHALLFGSIILLSVGYKFFLLYPEELRTLGFLLLGMGGVVAALLLIRSSLHPLCVRSAAVTAALIILALVAAWWGIWSEVITETVVFLTLLFGLVALLDGYGYFQAKTTK